MTLEKVIKVLENILTYVEPDDPPEQPEAIKIALEASRAYRQARNLHIALRCVLLPSETRE